MKVYVDESAKWHRMELDNSYNLWKTGCGRWLHFTQQQQVIDKELIEMTTEECKECTH